MRSSLLRGILSLLILASFTAAGFYSYRWYAAQQRKKALSLYFRTQSPVTRRMPADSILYVNLYKTRRLLDAMHNTRLSRVYGYWLDTGMGEKNGDRNPLMGGMLEKTLLNVFGEELGLAIAPGRRNSWDIIAIARLAPGSDFLLKLALSQNKKLERIQDGDNIIYVVSTRDPDYPRLYLSLDTDVARASSSLERLRATGRSENQGPAFLSGLPEELLPENTFLFVKGRTPAISILGFIEGRRLRIYTECSSTFEGPLPVVAGSGGSILELLTNIQQAFHRPATAYAIRNVEGSVISTALLAFDSEQGTQDYGKKLQSRDSSRQAPAPQDTIHYGRLQCSIFPFRKKTAMICELGALLLLSDAPMDPRPILEHSGVAASEKRPLTVQLKFNRDSVREFAALSTNDDWSRFAENQTLYFLSCLRGLEGGVDERQKEITLEFE